MGMRALDLSEWLIVDESRDDQLASKRQLVDSSREVVVATTPSADAASRELRGLIAAAVGSEPVDGVEHPLVDAALMVQEDLAVLQNIDGSWVVTAGVVCFPTHWTIGEKIGLPLAEVHRPVAHYERELRDRVDRFADRLTPDKAVWRRNWFVSVTDRLHLPTLPPGLAIPDRIEPDGSPMWIRSERQTLRRLPVSDAIVFTIRVQLAPLGVLRARPQIALRMLRAVESWDEAKRGYTSTGKILDALTRWLTDLTAPHDRADAENAPID